MGLIKEDNASGFHTGTVHTGVHRSVTDGNDAPVDVGLPKLKQSVKKAKDILMGKDGGNGMNSGNGGTTHVDSHDVYNYNYDYSIHHSGVADGLAWFGTHFKEIAIVAAASAAILAIAKLIKGANKSIKFRYNKVVKSLQKAQKDFTLAPDGMNMKSILPGIGSRLNDWITRTFSGNWKSRKGWKRQTAGNIGLHPFCQQYIDEIEADYRVATAAFSKIKLGADSLDSKEAGRNTDSSVGGAQSNVSTSAYSGKIYSSFHEAYSNELLNEGVSKDKLDESILATISAGVALTSLAVKAGTFLYQRFKNGKPEGDPKAIQVTAESTREICYAIINNYADKYVNMNQVFKELGIDSKSLADLDKSSVDKLRTILEKYEKPEKNAYTKQYSRINDAYKKMLNHYYKIGDGIIENFVKYSEASDEKHANLIVASKEKLKNMWDSQKEFYENNFSHVIVEIVSSEAYINYLDFIINKVLRVFKTGLAGDADYIFDVVPKKGEYYIIRQTGDQPVIDGTSELKGKSGIAEVIGFDKNTKNITFKFVGALKNYNGYSVSDDGIATLDSSDRGSIDYDVYKDKGDIELDYGKWLSIDPIQMDWTPFKTSSVFYTIIKRGSEEYYRYVYAPTTYEDQESKGYDKIYVVTTKRGDRDVVGTKEIVYSSRINDDDYNAMCKNDLRYWSMSVDSNSINYWNDLFKEGVNKENAETIDEIVEIIKNTPISNKPVVKAVSTLYIKNDNESGKTEYAYAIIDETDESFKDCRKEVLNEDDGNDEDVTVVDQGSDAAKKKNVKMIVFGCVDKDVNILEMKDDDSFNGAVIMLGEPCSVDQVHDKLTDLGFSGSDVKDDVWRIKSVLFRLIFTRSNVNKQTYTDEFELSHIGVAMKEISERKGSDEKVQENIDKWASQIFEKVTKELEGKSLEHYFDLRSDNPLNKKIYMMNTMNGKSPYFSIQTNIKSDKSGEQMNLGVIPTAVKNSDKIKDLKNAVLGVILFINKNYYVTIVLDSVESVKEGLNKLFNSFMNNKPVEDNGVSVFIDDGQSISQMNIGQVANDLWNSIKIDEVRKKWMFKTAYTEGKIKSVKIISKPDEFPIVADIVGTEIEIKIGINPSSIVLVNKQSNKTSSEHKFDSWDKYGSISSSLISAFKEVSDDQQKESVNITYKTKTSVSESTNISTVNIKRKISGRFKNWYVLSEAVYDDGSGYKSKLDNTRMIDSMTERSDFSKFAKASKLAKFMPFESQQEYTLVSDKGHTPSVATPLYESVVLVKFDKMDNVIDKIVVGKFKID